MSQLDKIAIALAPQPQDAATAQRDDWLDITSVFRILRRRFLLIAAVTLVLLALMILPIANMKHLYMGQSRMLMREASSVGLPQAMGGPQGELNIAIEVERLLARDVAIRVIDELDLDQRPEFNQTLLPPSLSTKVRAALHDIFVPAASTEPASPDDEMDGIVLAYLGHLSISRMTGSQVLNIEFVSEDPELSAQVPNTLIRIYLEERKAQMAERLDVARGWLDRRIEEQRQHVANADAEAKHFRENSNVSSFASMDLIRTVSNLTERRSEIGVERKELQARGAELDDILAGERWSEAPEIEGQPGLIGEYMNSAKQVAHLRETLGGRNPEVVTAEARLEDAAGLIRASVIRQKQVIDGRLAALDREDASLASRLETATTTLTALRSAEADQAALERAAQSEQATLDSLEEQRRSLRVEADIPADDVEVLLPATVPDGPMGRGRMFYVVVAAIAASAIGFAAALLRELLDTSARSADHVRQIPGAAPVGLLPQIPARDLDAQREGLATAPAVLFSDGVRAMIFALEQSRGGKMPRSLLVTSARCGEGKTTVAAAMARELAASGQRVLLVDGALRVGDLHRPMRARAEPGLGEYLAGKAELDSLVQRDVLPGVDFLGRGAADSQWHLDRGRLKALIDGAVRQGQCVIVDSAPALAQAFTPVLGSVVDRQLVVVRWGKTRRDTLATTVQRLSHGNGEEVVVALNAVDLKRHAHYGFSDAGESVRTLRRFHRRTT